jgi:hypothetical protein
MHLNEEDLKPKAVTFPYPGASVEEKTCRQVIHWVETEMHVNPSKRNEELLRQLRMELADLAARPNGIHLLIIVE